MGLFSSSVMQLTPYNFDTKLNIKRKELDGSTIGLVIFFTNWCGYCKNVAPELSKTATALGSSFPIFALDCEKYPELCKKIKIQSYPTIRYINKNGSLGSLYSGERLTNSFLADICKRSSKCM